MHERVPPDASAGLENWTGIMADIGERSRRLLTDFMAKNQYTFPVIIDHDRVAVQAYAIEGFPTAFTYTE